MKPENLMIVGIVVVILSVALCLTPHIGLPDVFVMALAGAAVFGKGYGVHEERQKRSRS